MTKTRNLPPVEDRPHSYHKKWTGAQDRQLRTFKNEGLPVSIMGTRLGRSPKSVETRLYRLGWMKEYRIVVASNELIAERTAEMEKRLRQQAKDGTLPKSAKTVTQPKKKGFWARFFS